MARPRKTADTTEMQQGQDQSFDVPSTGNIDRSEFTDNFEVVDSPIPKKTLDKMAFYEESVEVEILPTENPTAEQVISLCNGGINQRLIRGIPQTIKRKFVEILAQAKTENITTPQFQAANGDQTTRIVKTQGLRYPFRVLRDDNPNGREWLESILRQGA